MLNRFFTISTKNNNVTKFTSNYLTKRCSLRTFSSAEAVQTNENIKEEVEEVSYTSATNMQSKYYQNRLETALNHLNRLFLAYLAHPQSPFLKISVK